jgi:hypothetical protein
MPAERPNRPSVAIFALRVVFRFLDEFVLVSTSLITASRSALARVRKSLSADKTTWAPNSPYLTSYFFSYATWTP